MLEALFAPNGIALIGASTRPQKLGHGIARNLLASGYPGDIYFVNPRGGELFGHPLHKDIQTVPGEIDLAVIATPAASVPGLMAALGARGVKVAVVVSGGFGEAGEEGRDLESELVNQARRQDVRLLGPNCIGFLDTHLPVDITFLPPPLPPSGEIAFLSHSGALCGALIDWARGMGFGFSRLINPGNTSDISEAELLTLLGTDANTRVVSMYLESLKDAPGFLKACQELSGRKPLLALKVGRSEAGVAAAQSHTGALAGEDAAFTAAFRKAGVHRARTVEELLSWARALAWSREAKGHDAAVLTNAGGPGVVAADAVAYHDLRLAKLSPATVRKLSKALPGPASTGNPVDMLPSADASVYERVLRALLDDPNVHAVLPIIVPPPLVDASEVVEALIPVCRGAAKPVLVTVMGFARAAEAIRRLNEARIPAFGFPEQAVSALQALVQRAENLERADGDPLRARGIEARTREALRTEIRRWAGPDLPTTVATGLLAAYSLPVPDQELVRSAEQAVRSAERIGFPVALKISSSDVAHKTDVGGVLLDLDSASVVKAAYGKLIRAVSRSAPQAEILGVLVQPMAPQGQDVILGMTRDPSFGPMLMFGSGGTEVEGLEDVSFALPPLSGAEAERLLDDTWAGRRMRGYRDLPPGDRLACIDALVHLHQLAVDFPELEELEINPLRVFPAGEGVLALDVRARVSHKG